MKIKFCKYINNILIWHAGFSVVPQGSNSFGGSITHEIKVYMAVLHHLVFFAFGLSICLIIFLCTTVWVSCNRVVDINRMNGPNSSFLNYMVATETFIVSVAGSYRNSTVRPIWTPQDRCLLRTSCIMISELSSVSIIFLCPKKRFIHRIRLEWWILIGDELL